MPKLYCRYFSSVSSFALAAALLATPQHGAHAASECGADTAGPSSVDCTGSSYSTILYAPSDGLTVNLANPNMAVTGPASFGAVRIGGTSANDLIVNATSFGSITNSGAGGGAIYVINNGAGSAAITMNAGSASTTQQTAVLTAITDGAGDARVTQLVSSSESAVWHSAVWMPLLRDFAEP